jgi:hypothetical protein
VKLSEQMEDTTVSRLVPLATFESGSAPQHRKSPPCLVRSAGGATSTSAAQSGTFDSEPLRPALLHWRFQDSRFLALELFYVLLSDDGFTPSLFHCVSCMREVGGSAMRCQHGYFAELGVEFFETLCRRGGFARRLVQRLTMGGRLTRAALCSLCKSCLGQSGGSA